VSKYDLM